MGGDKEDIKGKEKRGGTRIEVDRKIPRDEES